MFLVADWSRRIGPPHTVAFHPYVLPGLDGGQPQPRLPQGRVRAAHRADVGLKNKESRARASARVRFACGLGIDRYFSKFDSKKRWLQEDCIFQDFDQNKVISIKIQGRQTSLRPQLTWYCSQIVVGRGGDCCCRPPLHNPPIDRSATRANRDARTQHTSIFFVPCLPPPSAECGAEAYFEF